MEMKKPLAIAGVGWLVGENEGREGFSAYQSDEGAKCGANYARIVRFVTEGAERKTGRAIGTPFEP